MADVPIECCAGEPAYGDPRGLHSDDCPVYLRMAERFREAMQSRRPIVVLTRDPARAVPDHLVGDGPCHDCGGVNIRWYADSPLWNRVMGGPKAKDDPGGILCIHCFVKRADAAGYNPDAWHLSLPAEQFEDGA